MLETRSGKIKLAVVLALTLMLSACNLKSNTTLTFADDFSGTRVMTLDFSRDPGDSTDPNSRYAAIDKIIKKNLPEGLEYSGLTTSGDKASATFTLKFNGIEDYRNQILFLAQYSGIDAHPSITLVPADSPFVTGFYYDEVYTSFELLTWIYNALVSEGIMSEDEFQQVHTQEGSNAIVTPESKYQIDGDFLRTNNVADERFSSQKIYIKDLGDGSFHTTVNFFRDKDPSNELVEKEDSYINSIDINGLIKDSEPPSGAYQRTLSFYSDDTEELTKQLNKIFQTSDAKFFIDNTSKAQEHLVSAISYAGTLDTNKIIKDQSSKLFISGPKDLKPIEVHTEFPGSLSSFDTVLINELEVPRFDTNLEILDSSTGKLTLSFDVPIKQAEILDEDIKRALTPDRSLGTLKYTDNDGVRNYVITIPKITKDNAKKVNAFIGGTVEISPMEESESGDYHVALKFSPEEFIQTAPDENSATVSLPKKDSFISTSASATNNEGWKLKKNTAVLNDSAEGLEFSINATIDTAPTSVLSSIPMIWIYITVGIAGLLVILLVLLIATKRRK